MLWKIKAFACIYAQPKVWIMHGSWEKGLCITCLTRAIAAFSRKDTLRCPVVTHPKL